MKEKAIVDTFEGYAEIFKALGDENRIKILEMLQNGELCACRLLEDLDIRQSTLSHHMKILCESGAVNGRKEGKWIYYSICPEFKERMDGIVDRVFGHVKDNSDDPDRHACCKCL